MLSIRYMPNCLRRIKKLKRKHYDMEQFVAAVETISKQDIQLLSTKYRDHALKGELAGFRELHIQADWLLIYKIEHDTLTLVVITTGSYDDLF
ncbi:MAG: type II toxin-antitoxin system YafQ family toxin [Bifidobacterium aquikefiri]|uniref:YafQ family addiction module toxin component n=2 Tax=Bifidobacterium aquikefiri TaxID=1653207 RepID=A0A261G6T7_9BIFI|nr:YafQ family addiction module toxin component [Bifidobacterium aquikefiri]